MSGRQLVVNLVRVAAVVWLNGCGGGVSGGEQGGVPEGQVDVFAERIAPVLDGNCACHTSDSPASGISLRSYSDLMAQGLVTKGNSSASRLLQSMNAGGLNPYYLDTADADAVAAWIEDGAPRYAPEGTANYGAGSASSEFAGIAACANHCHGEAREVWLDGPHGNLNAIDERHQPLDLGLDSPGFPNFGYRDMGAPGAECTTVCHDQLGDGEQLTEGITGNVPRPVIGCESCHGGGGDHLAIPYPKPGADRCGVCHSKAFEHNKYHPEGDNIIEDYEASPHASSINEHAWVEEGSKDVKARCARCHTDEGAKLYIEVVGGHDELAAALPDDTPPVENASPVQCRTCHDKHDPDKLLREATTDADGNVVESAEFRTCTFCHQTGDAYHGEFSGHSWSGGYPFPVGVGAFKANRINYDTHYDDPATMKIEGYVLDVEGARTCRDCHNQHAADNTINNQWARSGHGGRIALVKETAAMAEGTGEADAQAIVDAIVAAGVTDDDAPAWPHYPFGAEYRSACARCHTSTGFKAFVGSLAALNKELASNPAYDLEADPEGLVYDPEVDIEYVDGAMSHLEFVTNDGSDAVVYDSATRSDNLAGIEKEMLYCWACHQDRSGAMRDPGPVTPDYTTTPFPDVGASNVCLACHMGRESGDTVAGSTDDFSNNRFVNSHYLSAGGTVFRTTGYEFPAKDYANVSYYKHQGIGTTELDENGETLEVYAGTGTSGPCVACHLGSAEGDVPNHLLLPFTYDETRQIVEITNPVCANCHRATETRDTSLSAAFLNEEREHYEDALHALEAQLAAAGYTFLGGYPYFSARDWLSAGDSDTTGNTTGKNNMGAAFNFNLLHHDPGGYAHNRYYVKRLIYDSIDWLDDNLLNDSVAATLDALDDGTSYKAGAATYLASIGR